MAKIYNIIRRCSTPRADENGSYFTDTIFKSVFFKESVHCDSIVIDVCPQRLNWQWSQHFGSGPDWYLYFYNGHILLDMLWCSPCNSKNRTLLYMCIYAVLILKLRNGETIITHKGAEKSWWPLRGSISSHHVHTETKSPAAICSARSFDATHADGAKNTSNGGTEAALDHWQPVWNEKVLISTPVS